MKFEDGPIPVKDWATSLRNPVFATSGDQLNTRLNSLTIRRKISPDDSGDNSGSDEVMRVIQHAHLQHPRHPLPLLKTTLNKTLP